MYQQYQPGWLEVITGPMFAGKSEELIRRIRTLSYAKNLLSALNLQLMIAMQKKK